MDQLLRHLNYHHLGVQIQNRPLPAIAYADDLILFADTPSELAELYDITVMTLEDLGLQINRQKSHTLHANIGLQVKDSLNYLGVEIMPENRLSIWEFHSALIKLHQAVLRGNQKVYFLRHHLLPSFYHRMTHEKTIARTLNSINSLVRTYVRKWTHLPLTTNSSFIHLKPGNGGMGIPDIRLQIPWTTRQRLLRLTHSPAWYTKYIATTRWFKNELNRIHRLCPEIPPQKWHLNNIVKFNPGHLNFLVGGANMINRHLRGDQLLHGRRYYRFLQLRSSIDHWSSGHRRPNPCHHCPDNPAPATLHHLLSGCPNNQQPYRQRHDEILDKVYRHLTAKGYLVFREQTLSSGLRPDLLVRTPKNKIYCHDVSICFELTRHSLKVADLIKRNKYRSCRQEIIRLMTRDLLPWHRPTHVAFYGLIFGCRGSIHNVTLNLLLRHFCMPKWKIEKLQSLVVWKFLAILRPLP